VNKFAKFVIALMSVECSWFFACCINSTAYTF